jgi:predicted RND superfamily exporter protein
MNAIKRLQKALLNLYYGLPFGLKAAGDEIMGGGEADQAGTEINQQVTDKRVAKHLLKGEVTQEVEELRYRTYLVANESEKYKYLGNGVAVKEEKEKPKDKTRFKFSQDNENICESVLNTMNQVGSYGAEKYRFEIDYNSFVRFKVEKFAKKVDVDIDEKIGKIETTLHFNTEPDPYDAASMPFINELKKLLGNKSEYFISKHEIASSIYNLSFTTYKAYNEDDLVSYSFIKGGKFKDFRQEGYEYLLTLTWDEYMRLPLDLESKYYSKSMAEKYAKKERKDVAPEMVNTERKRYCSVCGREMSVYDADIQEADGHKPICKDCLNKALKNEEK